MNTRAILLAALFAAAFLLAYGCAGNQPGVGVGNDSPPPPPDNSTIRIVGVNDVPPPPPQGN